MLPTHFCRLFGELRCCVPKLENYAHKKSVALFRLHWMLCGLGLPIPPNYND